MRSIPVTIAPGELDLVSAVLARYAVMLEPNIVEWEALDIIKEFLQENPLDMLTVDVLVKLVQSTTFDPEYNRWN